MARKLHPRRFYEGEFTVTPGLSVTPWEGAHMFSRRGTVMEKGYMAFAKSEFFSSAFNSAIYDGPLRIYFSREQEAMGLKLYFALMQSYQIEMKRLKEVTKETNRFVFVLIYPELSDFEKHFGGPETTIFKDYGVAQLREHKVIALKGPLEMEELTAVLHEVIAEVVQGGVCLVPEAQIAL